MADGAGKVPTSSADSPTRELARLSFQETIQALLAGCTLKLANGKDFSIGETARKVLAFYAAPTRRSLWEKEGKRGSKDEAHELLDALELPLAHTDAPAPSGGGAIVEWHLIQVSIDQFGGLHRHCDSAGNVPEPIVLQFDQLIHMLRGRNAAGKSQFARALTWGLTGHIPRAQAEPEPAETLTNTYTLPPRDSSGKRDTVLLPIIVPFPEGKDLACRPEGKPLLATSVTMTFESAGGTARVCLRRTLVPEKKGFSCPLEVLEPDGSVRPVASVHAALGVSEIAIEAAALTMARLPVLRLDSSNALTRGIAILTGLHPLKILGERLNATVLRHVKAEVPKEANKTLKEIEETFQAKVSVVAQQFRLGEALPAEVLPATPLAVDDGAACEIGLTALATELKRRDAAMREAIRAATGLDVEAADLKALRKKIEAARQALRLDNLTRQAEFIALERMRTLSSADLDTAKALLVDAQTQAEAFAQLDADKRQAARRRLYAAIDQWRHANDAEAPWPPDHCPVCASDLMGKVDDVLGKAVRDALAAAERDEAALTLDADDWNRQARQSLLDTLPVAVRQALEALTGTSAPVLFRAACTATAARCAGLTGDLAPLAAELEAEFARLAAALPADPESVVLVLPDSLRGCAFEATANAVLRLVTQAQWCQAAAADLKRIRDALFFEAGENGDPATAGLMTRRLATIDQALVSVDPLEAAKAALADLKSLKVKWDAGRRTLRLSAQAVPAVEELAKLDSVVSAQVDSLLTALDGRTAAWTDRLYLPPSNTAPELRGTRIKDGALHLPAERGGVEGEGRELLNGSRLRTHLFAFALALAEQIRQRDGGLSLLLLDDPQTLFDEDNQRRLAKGLGTLPGDGFRPLIVTFDHHFAASLFRQVPDPDMIKYLEITPRSTGWDRVRIARHRLHIDRAREEWRADDHNPALIVAFCTEARRTLECAFRDLIWPSSTAVTGDETLQPLREKLRALTRRADVYAEKPFKDLVGHAAFNDPTFREGINWAVHSPATQVVFAHAERVDTHLDALLRMVDAGQALLDQALTNGPLPTAATVIPFPERPCPAAKLAEIGRAAAQDGTAVDGEAVEEASGPVRLIPGRHRLLVVGRGLDWLPTVLTAGDVVVADADVEPDKGLAVVWDGERQTPFVGWLQPGRGVEHKFVLHGTPVQHLDKRKGFARVFDKDRCTVHAVAGILFAKGPASAKPLDFHEDDTPFAGMEGAVLIDAGWSAAPVLLPGHHVLVGPALGEINSTDALAGRIFAVRLDNGNQMVKRVGNALDRTGAARVLESIGEEGDSPPVRLAEGAGAAFGHLPAVEEMRPVLGYWFAAPGS